MFGTSFGITNLRSASEKLWPGPAQESCWISARRMDVLLVTRISMDLPGEERVVSVSQTIRMTP